MKYQNGKICIKLYTLTHPHSTRFRKETEKLPPYYKLPPATKYSILYDDDEDFIFYAADQCAITPDRPIAWHNI
jgi:hypothetical protein